MCSFEIDPDLEPGGADPVVVRVVDVERQLKRTARQTDPGDGDFLQLDVRFGERQAAEGGAGEVQQHHGKRESGNGKREVSCHYVSRFPFPVSRSIRSFTCLQNSIRSAMVFSYPNSLGSYHLVPATPPVNIPAGRRRARTRARTGTPRRTRAPP